MRPIFFTLLLLATPRAALADWHLGAEALTDFPVQVGGRVAVEGPERLRLSASLGVLPGPYVDVINDVVVAAGGYDDTTAQLIRAALEESLVFRLHAGWRPFADYGFYFDVGYGLAALGGGVTGEELVTAATGSAPSTGTAAGRGYDVGSVLHMLDAEVGWEWTVWEGLWVRAALGFAGTVASATTVEPDFTPKLPAAARAVDGFARFSEAYLDDLYTSYVFTPTLTVGVGYRFF